MPPLEDLRRARGGDAPRAEVVLEGDRDTGERSRVVASGDALVDAVGLRTRLGGQNEVEGVQLPFASVDARKVVVDDLASASFAAF